MQFILNQSSVVYIYYSSIMYRRGVFEAGCVQKLKRPIWGSHLISQVKLERIASTQKKKGRRHFWMRDLPDFASD